MDTFDTIYEMCTYLYDMMQPGETMSLNAIIHSSEMSFHVYKLPKNFVFDSADTVLNVLNLCLSVDTSTQVILGTGIVIKNGVTLTPPYRCKGMIIFDYDTFINNGIVSMTSRGCVAVGQDIYLFKNLNKTYEFVPAIGGAGAPAYDILTNATASHGSKGCDGVNRGTGGGGTGAGRRWIHYVSIGRGGNGTSYSGGAGSGAGNSDGSGGSAVYVTQGSDIGGAGSNGIVHARNSSGYSIVSTGGQGNPNGSWGSYRGNVGSVYSDVYGTGGLLIIYCKYLMNNGNIQANGGNTMYANSNCENKSTGGASGGGSVNIFFTNDAIIGKCTATGGQRYGTATYHGGPGGNGCVTIMAIGPVRKRNSNFYKDSHYQEIFDFNKLL